MNGTSAVPQPLRLAPGAPQSEQKNSLDQTYVGTTHYAFQGNLYITLDKEWIMTDALPAALGPPDGPKGPKILV